MTLNWKWRLLIPVILGAATMYVVARRAPDRYRAEATLMVLPQQIPEALVAPMVTTSLTERLPFITATILSRAKLEALIDENNLYAIERKTELMEDVVEKMKGDIEIGPRSTNNQPLASNSFTISYTSTNPQAAFKVTERLAALFKDQSLLDREYAVEHTVQFLEAQIQQTQVRLSDHAALLERWVRLDPSKRPDQADLDVTTIEKEVLTAQYKSLFAKREEARISASLEQQEIGEQFRVIDVPHLPDEPLGPTVLQRTIGGAVIGFGFGVLWVVIALVRRWSA